MFIGLVLIPPVVLKLASTGYRFVRYYTGARGHRAKGPPPAPLRALAPLLVATTLAIFATGVGCSCSATSRTCCWSCTSLVHRLERVLRRPLPRLRPRVAALASRPGGRPRACGRMGRRALVSTAIAAWLCARPVAALADRGLARPPRLPRPRNRHGPRGAGRPRSMARELRKSYRRRAANVRRMRQLAIENATGRADHGRTRLWDASDWR